MNIQEEIKMQTGDLILFRGTSWISKLVEWVGISKYSHIGIIIKNPKFLNPELEDGIYLLESSWNDTPDVEDKEFKVGVQLHFLEDVLKEYPKGSIDVRHIQCERNDSFFTKLIEIHKEIHNKPYDLNPCDWLCARYNIACPFPPNAYFQTKKSFWCSALVSYIFCELGLINKEINWTLMAPREFSSDEGKLIQFQCTVEKEKLLY
jgi:hypothetical protein